MDTTATIGEKQDMSKEGRRVILIYKAHVYNEASLDPERCTHKSDEKAKRAWLLTHIRQIDQYEDITSPTGEQQEDDIMDEEDADPGLLDRTEIPPSGSGAPIHTGGIASATAAAGTATMEGIPPMVTHLRFGTPEPPTIPLRDGGGTHTRTILAKLQNRFAPLRRQGANSGDSPV